jgi:4-amino-4-deoxy-L-arabinose transferase-like glycosyltransferase
MTRKLPAWCSETKLAPLFSILVFCLTGLALIPFPGLQNDELFFSGPIYSADAAFYRVRAGALNIPFMVMSYTGALKTWIYAALFQFVAPDLWSVRIPVLLMGMATIWLTWLWVRSVAGTRAAAVTAILLATDAIFQLTNTFDWGPVALQHILLMAGLVALQRWLTNESRRMLALGFFLWGLGMWDKALLSWPLIGLGAGVLCVYPRETIRRLRPLPVAIAVLSFLTGAAPLVWYNVARHGETASANARFTAEGFGGKAVVLRHTIDGSSLFSYIVYPDQAPGRHPPRTAPGRAAVALSGFFGVHKTNWMLPAYGLGLVCFVILLLPHPRRFPQQRNRRRLMAFLLIVVGVAWAQMAFNRGTGGAAHHTILLWPFPVAFLGIAFAEAAARSPRFGTPALAVLVTFLAAENLLNTNEYLAELATRGGSGGWTDAIYRLAGSVEKSPETNWYGLVDWGYLNALRMFHEGDLPLFVVADGQPSELKREIETPDCVFIQHTEDKQIFPGVNDRLRQAAAGLGYGERVERVIRDRNGRPVFELFRFVKAL